MIERCRLIRMNRNTRIGRIVCWFLLCSLVVACSGDSEDILEGPPTPVYPDMDEFPAWSPDGSKILYHHNGITEVHSTGAYWIDTDSCGLWMMNADGSNAHILLTGMDMCADWSPDGEWIVFEESAQIWKVKLHGEVLDWESLQQLTSSGRNFFPDWSPDCQWTVYDSNVGSEGYRIWKMKSHGGSKRLVVGGRGADWSPSDSSIIYVGLHREIYRYSFDSLSETRLTWHNADDIYATDKRYPQFSPNGNRIAFQCQCEGDIAIWIMNSDGSDLHRVVDGKGPSWSPDGQKIAFIGDHAGTIYEKGTVWVVNVDGSGLTQLTRGLPE